jgi:SET domain-containing protein
MQEFSTIHLHCIKLNYVLFYYSIDATDEPSDGPMMGRLVNHSKTGNAYVSIVASHQPCICLFAKRYINAGEQVLYDYGVAVPFVDQVLRLF